MRRPRPMLPAAMALVAVLAVPAPAVQADDGGEPTIAEEGQEGASSPRGQTPALYRADLERPDTLGLGRAAHNVARKLPAVEAMASYLGERLSPLGYERVRPVIARDNAELVDFLRRGIVDVVSETPMSAMHLVCQGGATIILRERRRGHATYRSVLVVRDDSPIRTLADLRGHRVAFEDTTSTTAFLLPLAEMRTAGLRAVETTNPPTTPPTDAVEYSFLMSESAILTSIERHTADAGALSDEDWEDFRKREPDAAANLRVIYESAPIPRAFVLTGPTVSAEQRKGVRAALLAMQSESSGRRALEKYDGVDGFDEIDSDLESEIASLETMYNSIREDVR